MRAAAALLTLAGIVSANPAQAEFLLNCRLMDSAHPIYRQHCKAETGYLLASECLDARICIVKKQNFKGIYSDGLGLELDGIRTATSSLLAAPGETLASTSLAGATPTLGRTAIAARTSSTTNTLGNVSKTATGTLAGAADTAGGLLR